MFKVYFANCLVCLDTSTLIMKLWKILWTLLQKMTEFVLISIAFCSQPAYLCQCSVGWYLELGCVLITVMTSLSLQRLLPSCLHSYGTNPQIVFWKCFNTGCLPYDCYFTITPTIGTIVRMISQSDPHLLWIKTTCCFQVSIVDLQ